MPSRSLTTRRWNSIGKKRSSRPLDEADRNVRPALQGEVLERLVRLLRRRRPALDHLLWHVVQELEEWIERGVRVTPVPTGLLSPRLPKSGRVPLFSR